MQLCVCVCVCRMQNLDMPTAVKYLSESDAHLQVVGAAFVQHQCFHSRDAKHQVRPQEGHVETVSVEPAVTGGTNDLPK